MKKLLIFFVLLLIIFVAAIFIGPGFISSSMIQTAVKEQAGIDLQIQGNSNLSIFPEVVFKADGIKIKAYDGNIPLLTSEDIRIQLGFSELLAGKVLVKDFYWNKPKVYLEVSEKGVPNWLPKRKSRHSSGSGLGFLKGVDQSEIKKVSLKYYNAQTGQEYTLDDGQIRVTSKEGKTDLNFSAKMSGVPLTLTGAFDLSNPAGTPFKSVLTIAKENKVKLEGRVLDPFSNPSFSGDLSIDGQTFVTNLKTMFGLQNMELDEIPLKLASDVRYEKGDTSLSDFNIDLGKMSIGGIINYTMKGNKPFLEAQLKGSVLDLNTLGACGGSEGKKPETHVWSSDVIDLTELHGMESSINLSWDKFVCNNFEFQPFNVRARVNKEGVLIDEVRLTQATGGYFTTKGKIEGTTDLKGQLQLRWNELALEQILPQSSARFVEIPVTGTSDLTFTGKTMRQFVDSLDGNIKFNANTGKIKGIDLTNLMAATMDMIMGTQPGIKNNYELAYLKAEYGIDKGVIQTKEAELKVVSGLQINGSGKVSLPDWTISYALDAKKHGKLIPKVQIKGSLSNPKVTVDAVRRAVATGIGAVVGGPAGAALGAAIDVLMDAEGNVIEPNKEEALPFDLKDKENLKDNIKEFLNQGFGQ